VRMLDIALLIKAHEFRNTDFESAVHDVLDKATTGSEELKAHVYATVVETCQPHTPVEDLEQVITQAYEGWAK